jgi:RNA polymerase sigma-70 factor (ECF subfamily)
MHLYSQYRPTVYSRCLRLLKSAAAAEDAAHETFVRVQRHLASAPRNDEALAWISRIATNYCLNELRRRKNYARVEEQLPSSSEVELVEERMADRDLVRRLLARSPDPLRAAALLRHVDGLEQAEVARALGVSRRSVVNYLATFQRFARKYVTQSEQERRFRPASSPPTCVSASNG